MISGSWGCSVGSPPVICIDFTSCRKDLFSVNSFLMSMVVSSGGFFICHMLHVVHLLLHLYVIARLAIMVGRIFVISFTII